MGTGWTGMAHGGLVYPRQVKDSPQHRKHSDWNENVPHRLVCFNIRSPVGGAVWGGMEPLGGRTLQEKSVTWGGV